MKKHLFFLFLGIVCFAKAQSNTDYLKEINRDIWQPFIEAYNTLNVEKYKNLQTEDFLRVEGTEKRLRSPKDYFDGVGSWFDEIKKDNRKMSISFRFTERFANEKKASERGIYELRMFDATDMERLRQIPRFYAKNGKYWEVSNLA